MSRREVLRAAGYAGIGLALGINSPAAAVPVSPLHDGHSRSDTPAERIASSTPTAIPFHDRHQAGIATPAQNHMHFAAFDVTTDNRDQLQQLLRTWSEAAARMCEGKPLGEPSHPSLPPEDTGEALGHGPARLTLTFGFGPTLFERDGVDRFGLAGQRPNQFADIPAMPGDELDPGRSGGDLCIQACADDPQVAFHAVHNLVRVANGVARLRWWQAGFSRASSTNRSQETPRNLHGFKDGTNNLKTDDKSLMDRHVWVHPADGEAWMRGGTYLVARRIRMHIEEWDNSSLDDQEKAIGRHKVNGAPIGVTHERAPLDLEAKGPDGGPLIPTNAHVRLSRGDNGEQILRRSYSYMDGVDKAGKVDAGLFFVCFQRAPLRQFVAIQRRLAAQDALNEYITHTASAVFACPPGAREGGYVGETLFENL